MFQLLDSWHPNHLGVTQGFSVGVGTPLWYIHRLYSLSRRCHVWHISWRLLGFAPAPRVRRITYTTVASRSIYTYAPCLPGQQQVFPWAICLYFTSSAPEYVILLPIVYVGIFIFSLPVYTFVRALFKLIICCMSCFVMEITVNRYTYSHMPFARACTST